MKRPVASSWISARFIFLLKSKSKVSSERSGSRKRGLFVPPLEEAVLPPQQFVGDERRHEIDRRRASRSGPAGGGFRGRRPCPRGGVDGARDRVRRDSWRVSCFAIDEIAIEGELPNERVDLAERQRHRQTAFEIAPQKAIGRDAEIERGFGGVVDDGRAMFLREREDAEDAADAGGAVVLMDVVADDADGRPGALRRAQGPRRQEDSTRTGQVFP